MLRYLNVFVVIGLLLVLFSIVGFATGSRFVTDPGQPVNPRGSLIYLAAGIIMLVNGWVSIRTAPPAHQKEAKPAPQSAPGSDHA